MPVLSSSHLKSGDRALPRLKRRAVAFLKQLKLSDCELSLTLVGDAEIRRVNAEWRGKDKPTDVLSFPAGDHIGPGPRSLGDIIISLPTARRQAREYDRPLNDELDRYLAHGLLHLLGHDHHRKADAAKMAAAETRLLGRGGMVPPAA